MKPWMDVAMDGCIHEDGWMEPWMNEAMDPWLDGAMDEWKNGPMDGWSHGWMEP